MQRNELLSKKQYKLRKIFGRLIFTNFFVNFFQNPNIEKNAEFLFSKEIETFKNYLPHSVKNIIDIGCGLGIINIYLNNLYLTKPKFFLLDKNKIDKKIKYGFSYKYESYNDLNETKKLLLENKINIESIKVFDVEKQIKISEKIDLVISLKSMGYHYPFEIYKGLFKKCCSSNTVFIFDVADDYFNEKIFRKYFDTLEVIYEEKSIHPLKRLYCTNLKF